ncbi:MAG: hypothetical protein IH830_11250 [Planctomycetes bacterium]|nr:hypothetical protein [Planctomycetota bacterium]
MDDAEKTRIEALKETVDRYERAYQADNSQFWRLFSLMTIVVGGLLYVVLSTADPALWLASALVAIPACVIWSGTQLKYGGYCQWWNDRVGETNAAYLKAAGVDDGTKGDGDAFSQHANRPCIRGFSTRKSFRLLPIFFIFAWALVLVYAVSDLAGWSGFTAPASP